MGNVSTKTHKDKNIFEHELKTLNNVVNNIINTNDLFINKDYDFLSQDVCKKYNIILEEELNKHLKIDLKLLGKSLYILPKEDSKQINKDKICQMIRNHYIKILYILCLIKYVYNLENNGDLSLAGIVFGNIRIVQDEMTIQFCELPHKDYSTEESIKIDFSKLKGMEFFTKYFLDANESNIFLGILKSALSRAKKNNFKHQICKCNNINDMKELYQKHFNEKLMCGGNLNIYIAPNNPVFSYDLCRAVGTIRFKITTKAGKEILNQYNIMKKNYDKNINDIETILNELVLSNKDTFVLKDITKERLETIIEHVKSKIQIFYIQTILDYQHLLDNIQLLPKFEKL
jgi:hypothetical protein